MIPSEQRPLLVLDVDETLIHCPDGVLDRPPDFWVGEHAIYERPGVREFLVEVSKLFDLAVWSSASRSYVVGILAGIAGNITFELVWGAERCTPRRGLTFGDLHWLKDIKKLERRGRDRRRVLMVDDSPEKLARNYGNAIYVQPFEGDPADAELPALAAYLSLIAAETDYRRLEKRGWRARSAAARSSE